MAHPYRVVMERTYPITLDEAWTMLANTEHINRTVGLPSISYDPVASDAAGFYRPAAATLLGRYTVRWKEYPFSWVHGERYAVVRAFAGTPVRQIVAGVELSAVDGGTRVRFLGEIVPRNALGALVGPLVVRRMTRDIQRYCDRYVAQLGAGRVDPLPRSRTRTPVAVAHLDLLLGRLAAQPVDTALIPRLRQRLVEGTDEEVLRMRPFALADAWRADRYAVLRLFLYATKVGILNLRWDLLCPVCRVPKAEYGSMVELQGQFHCDLCGIDITATLDRHVELRFSVHPAVRAARDAIYCIGGPANTPHILAQQYLAPGDERTVTLGAGAEALRARTLRTNAIAALERQGDAEVVATLSYHDDGWRPDRVAWGGSVLRLRLRNATAQPVVAVIERTRWDDQVVTAAQVAALQEFRDLFSAEVLAPGEQIGIESVALLFTDLKGSTALYELLGDAPAYGQVRKHFRFLIEAVTRNRGALVKTIGDAVMAVFTTPVDAVRAALEIQTQVAAFNRAEGLDPPLVIKLGVHHGPVIAINANDRFDYFGRTVNLAARIQQESVGGDVVMSEALFHEPAIQDVLRGVAYTATPFAATLRGVPGALPLRRVVPTGVASVAASPEQGIAG